MQVKISGKIVRGDGYGRKIGFPTANIENLATEPPSEITEGVYAGTAELEGVVYRAGIVLGPQGKVEAHLIGYNDNAYGKKITLNVGKFLRKYQYFDTEQELINQIKKDISQC